MQFIADLIEDATRVHRKGESQSFLSFSRSPLPPVCHSLLFPNANAVARCGSAGLEYYGEHARLIMEGAGKIAHAVFNNIKGMLPNDFPISSFPSLPESLQKCHLQRQFATHYPGFSL